MKWSFVAITFASGLLPAALEALTPGPHPRWILLTGLGIVAVISLAVGRIGALQDRNGR